MKIDKKPIFFIREATWNHLQEYWTSPGIKSIAYNKERNDYFCVPIYAFPAIDLLQKRINELEAVIEKLEAKNER